MTDLSVLWARGFGADWAVAPAALSRQLAHSTIIADESGFIAFQIQGRKGSVQAMAVVPERRRQGIGTRLLDTAFPAGSVDRITLGSGGRGYLWPGVPQDLEAARSFFEARGFAGSETAYDLVGAADLLDLPSPDGIAISAMTLSETPVLLDFEARHFPGWLDYFAAEAPGNILLARRGADIIGSVIVSDPDPDFKWRGPLGGPTSELGCIGVCPDARESGIGRALASAAGREMRARGAERVFVGWTWLDRWYESLGYRIWRRYDVMSRTVSAST